MTDQKIREDFEADAKPYGFDMTRDRMFFATDDPWIDYVSIETGHRWGGWLAGCESKQDEIDNWKIVAENWRVKAVDWSRKNAELERRLRLIALEEYEKIPVDPEEVCSPHTIIIDDNGVL